MRAFFPFGLLFLGIGVLALILYAGLGRPGPGDETADTEVIQVTPVAYGSLPEWRTDRLEGTVEAFQRSCERVRRQPEDRARRGFKFPGGDPFYGIIEDWLAVCSAAATVGMDPDERRRFFEENFTPIAITVGQTREGLMTGYFEPEYAGSLTRDETYQTPLHGLPPDLVTASLGAFSDDFSGRQIFGRVEGNRFVPYAERRDIRLGEGLPAETEELIYLADPVDAFFLEIQGSGRIRLPDGGIVRIGYAGKNGRAYVPIGRVLREQGALAPDNISMQTIREWLTANPDQAPAIMDANPSYVFFRKLDLHPALGPIGAQGVPLTTERSLAVDRRYHSLGVPVYLETTLPVPPGDTASQEEPAYRRLMIMQDTGGAIRGPVRGDVFFGSGEGPGEVAGRMAQPGRFTVLLPKALAAQHFADETVREVVR